ncbi:MAG TPA: lipopolysaccharide assembly protein LapA domain-containing protein [Nitrospinota bacterium]|nr:lipopolysaccharide assembly protein LapA domain-containing protein [Nitrospinota bacterium]
MITIIFILIIIAIVALFSAQNAATVSVSFLTWKFEESLAIVIVLCVFIGIIIGVIISFLLRRKKVTERKINLP